MPQQLLEQILRVDEALDAKHLERKEFLKRLTRAQSVEECRMVLQDYDAYCRAEPEQVQIEQQQSSSVQQHDQDPDHQYLGKLHADPLLGGVGDHAPWLHLYVNRSAGDLAIRTEGIVPMYMLAYYPIVRDLLLEKKLALDVVDARITALALLEVPRLLSV